MRNHTIITCELLSPVAFLRPAQGTHFDPRAVKIFLSDVE
jgi:hypothetical protein